MTAEQIRDTFYELEELENHNEKAQKLLQLVHKLRGMEEEELEYDIRSELMSTYYYIYTSIEEEMANFGWLLQYEEKHPSYFTTQQVMWFYKWMAIRLVSMPHVPMARILGVLEDMGKRYSERHFGMRPVYAKYKDLHIMTGEKEKAKTYFQKEKEADTTVMDDCYACQLNGNLDYYLLLEEYEKVLENAQPLLDGEYSCGRVPQSTYSEVVEAYIAMGKWEEVEKYTDKGLHILDNDFSFVGCLIVYLYAYALLGRFEDAKKMMEAVLDKILSKNNPLHWLSASVSIEIFMELLAFKGENEIHLNAELHQKLDAIGLKGNATREFKQFFGKKTRELRKQFDERNGNSYFMDSYKKKWNKVATAPFLGQLDS